MSNRKITIYDIAKEAGVSASQVSRAISGNGYVSEENKEIIMGLVEKYNYRPSAVARNLKKGRSSSIGFLIPHVYQEYFPYLYQKFEHEMTAKGYITIVCNGRSWCDNEIRNLQLLEDLRVDAAVIMGGTLDQINWEAYTDYIQAVKNLNSKIPCVLGTERAAELDCPGVYVDACDCVDEMMAYLAGAGYRKMGIMGGVGSVYPSVRLKALFREAAERHGLEIRPQWVVNSSYNSMDGAEAMKQLLQQKELPEVVCCVNDEVAVGAMGVALDAGMKIPGDMAFTGYGGVWLGREFRPQLTTIQFDFETMGRILAETVLGVLNGSGEKRVIPVAPWLEIRESTGGERKQPIVGR